MTAGIDDKGGNSSRHATQQIFKLKDKKMTKSEIKNTELLIQLLELEINRLSIQANNDFHDESISGDHVFIDLMPLMDTLSILQSNLKIR